MFLKNYKYFHDPFERLDQKWQYAIAKGYLTVTETAELSGFSRQYVNSQILSGKIKSVKGRNGTIGIRAREFTKWYSSLDVLPSSPIGKSSFSLKGLMKQIRMGRAWVLKFADRNNISCYYLGKFRRFDKEEAIVAWDRERFLYQKWITVEEATLNMEITQHELYMLVATHLVRTRKMECVLHYLKSDIAKNIERLRVANSLKQEDFAKRLNVSRPTVSNWEQGKAIPTTDQLVKIAEEFNISSVC